MVDAYETLYKARCKVLLQEKKDYNRLNDYRFFSDIELMTEERFKEIIRRKQNRKNKRYRVKEKYIELYKLSEKSKESKIVFGTITLDDHYLNLKEDTYMRDINNWLKRHFTYSILNKDFGIKTEREHYHFIGLTSEEIEDSGKKSQKGYKLYNLKMKDYKLGFEPNLEMIDLKENDLNKTINYLLKLNNHSTKISTKSRIRVIKKPLVDVLFYKIKN